MTTLLNIEDLRKTYAVKKGLLRRTVGTVKAVDGVSFSLDRGETLGLVGESGCGKSTVGKAILRLVEPSAGKVTHEGLDVLSLSADELKHWRRHAQMVFQDPYSSLNPRRRVFDSVSEGLQIHDHLSRQDLEVRVGELLDQVGLNPEMMRRFPHEFSGGQRQRIGIARAISINPSLIVADEPVSALDVSVQAQILRLFMSIQEKTKMAYVFISHDLRVIESISTRVIVMYLGKMMEVLENKSLKTRILHPYAKLLFDSAPEIGKKRQDRPVIVKGEVPNAMNPPQGCVFHPRCPLAVDRCKKEVPVFREIENKHFIACHLV